MEIGDLNISSGALNSTVTTTVTHTAQRFDYNPIDMEWIMLTAFAVFSMQIGFGVFACGIVSKKNQVNIIFKSCIDTVCGAFGFWLFGYGFSYGSDPGSNPFMSFGYYFMNVDIDDPELGGKYLDFFYYLAFSSTATTIVGGALAERVNFVAYAIFAFFNIALFGISTSWTWGDYGWLKMLGFVDLTGGATVHLFGGAAAIGAVLFVGPRANRYGNGKEAPQMGNTAMAFAGFMILWFCWLPFNASSSFAVTGSSWKWAARGAVVTSLASFAGGLTAVM